MKILNKNYLKNEYLRDHEGDILRVFSGMLTEYSFKNIYNSGRIYQCKTVCAIYSSFFLFNFFSEICMHICREYIITSYTLVLIVVIDNKSGIDGAPQMKLLLVQNKNRFSPNGNNMKK